MLERAAGGNSDDRAVTRPSRSMSTVVGTPQGDGITERQ